MKPRFFGKYCHSIKKLFLAYKITAFEIWKNGQVDVIQRIKEHLAKQLMQMMHGNYGRSYQLHPTQIYSDNQKTLKYKDDFKTQIMTLHDPRRLEHRYCSL